MGLLCMQQRPEDKPNMSSLVLMLGGEYALPNPKQLDFFRIKKYVLNGLVIRKSWIIIHKWPNYFITGGTIIDWIYIYIYFQQNPKLYNQILNMFSYNYIDVLFLHVSKSFASTSMNTEIQKCLMSSSLYYTIIVLVWFKPTNVLYISRLNIYIFSIFNL